MGVFTLLKQIQDLGVKTIRVDPNIAVFTKDGYKIILENMDMNEFSDDKWYNTTTPLDFCSAKAKTLGIKSLSSLQKAFYFFGKELTGE